MISEKVKKTIAMTTLLGLVSGIPMPVEASTDGIVDFKILGTTDLHANLMNYDYYNGKTVDDYGLSKVSTVIKETKSNMGVPKNDKGIDNSILLDNGDTMQGSALGDYYKSNALEEGHPVYKTMDSMGFDVANLGNHEFNYGLGYLNNAVQGLEKMSIISSNIFDTEGKHMFSPYEIIEETVLDSNNKERKLKIGVVGVAPPQINVWDRIILDGKVMVEDMVESTKKTVDKLRNEEKVDIVVALAHSGYGDEEYSTGEENVGYEITKIDGIDAFIAGHTHETFPSKKSKYNSMANVDFENGTMNGVPTVMAGRWGNNLGVIDLKLKQKATGEWEVLESKTENKSVIEYDSDKEIESLVNDYHNNAEAYVNEPIGKISKDLNTFFATVKDNSATELIANVQKDYIEKGIENGDFSELEKYKDLPILSSSAPFRSGVGAIDIPKGEISVKDATSLYQYTNTIAVVKLTGEEIKDVLEMTSSIFNKINPAYQEEQELFNDKFIGFNFDSIEGLNYEVDITKDVKYNEVGDLVNPESSRITNITYNGNPLDMSQEFLVVTNSYRAGGGGNFPHLASGDKIVFSSDREVRELIIEHLKESKEYKIEVDNNWSIKQIEDSIANITFTSNVKGADYLEKGSNIELVEKIDEEVAKYKLDLAKTETTKKDSPIIITFGVLGLVVATIFGLKKLKKKED